MRKNEGEGGDIRERKGLEGIRWKKEEGKKNEEKEDEDEREEGEERRINNGQDPSLITVSPLSTQQHTIFSKLSN